MFYYEADVEIEIKAKMEEVRLIKVPNDDPFAFFKEYNPEKEDYILFSCDDGKVIIAIPKEKH